MSHPKNHCRMGTDHGGGEVAFRLLCHVDSAGGVIGPNGSIIDQLRRQTSTKIVIDEALPNCLERVINIFGDTLVSKKVMIVQNFNKTEAPKEQLGQEQVKEVIGVSSAQEGLLRVFERIIEVEGLDKNVGLVGCRLLAGLGQMGAVLGKQGRIIKAIQHQTGATVRYFNKNLPPCASSGDEVIQITGYIMAVKKALLAVSRRLQDFPPLEYQNPKSLQTHTPLVPSYHASPTDHPMWSDLDRSLSSVGKGVQRQVSFRLLCTNHEAGGIIGRDASIVKALEIETGTSIRFSAPIATSNERVVTIVSVENPDPLRSPAQVALERIFTRSIELQNLGEAASVTARVLVAPEEIDCLIDEVGRVASDIFLASNVEIQLLGADFAPSCARKNDIVVQILGAFVPVKETLFQITGRLREKLFSSNVSDQVGSRHHFHSSSMSRNSFARGTTVSGELDQPSNSNHPEVQDSLGYAKKLGLHSPKLPHEQFKIQGNTTSVANGGDLVIPKVGSADTGVITNVSVEIVLSEQSFSRIYGESGSNLARLKEISGAAVTLQDPCPGKCDGKIIISGTLERVQIAQSLLQAFTLL